MKLKLFLTHLLAATLGMLVAILWSEKTDDSGDSSASTKKSERSGSDGIGSQADTLLRARSKATNLSIAAQISKQITIADLEAWLASKEGDPRSYGEALVIAGLLTDNPEFVRKGIEADPKNGHLLFIGATLGSFSDEERLAMSKRLVDADPENGLAACAHASNLFRSGQTDAAIEILKSTAERPGTNDFMTETQLLMEEAYASAGLSPIAAKVGGTFNVQSPVYSEMLALTNSVKGTEDSLPPDEAANLRALTASMGQRLADHSRSKSVLTHLTGIAVEKATLNGLPDDALSPYNGLTVGQARESINAQQQQIREAIENTPDLDTLSNDPELLGRYIDRARLVGELEAIQWLQRETEGKSKSISR